MGGPESGRGVFPGSTERFDSCQRLAQYAREEMNVSFVTMNTIGSAKTGAQMSHWHLSGCRAGPVGGFV